MPPAANRNNQSHQHSTHITPQSSIRYDSQNHIQILCSMHGSVWSRVVVFCLLNCVITFGVHAGKHWYGIDLTFNDKGHTFMSILVAFLVVTRNQIVYARYMQCSNYLAELFRCCRELVVDMAVLTSNIDRPGVKEWRYEVSRRTITMLQITNSFLCYREAKINIWDEEDLNDEDREELVDLRASTAFTDVNKLSSLDYGSTTASLPFSESMTCDEHRDMEEENAHRPIYLAYLLRKTIASYKYYFEFVHVNMELMLYAHVSAYVQAFHGIKRLIQTPFPFPLIQMGRSFLFFWVFTLPFALVKDIDRLWPELFIIFFLTYGFIGLEFVSMEMDDPFGDDPNDFDNQELAKAVYEDIYIILTDCNGAEDAARLRKRVCRFNESFNEKYYQKGGSYQQTTIADDSFFSFIPSEDIKTYNMTSNSVLVPEEAAP